MSLNERLVFATSVEGLVKGLELTAGVRAELQALGIDLDRPLLPAYPAELYHRALHLIALRMYPTLGLAEAHRKLGERTVYGLESTLLGKAMLAMAKLLGPRRTLLRLPNSAKSHSNYSQVEVRELAPTALLIKNTPFMGFGEYMQGSVGAALELSGAVNGAVEIVDYDRSSETLVIRAGWDA